MGFFSRAKSNYRVARRVTAVIGKGKEPKKKKGFVSKVVSEFGKKRPRRTKPRMRRKRQSRRRGREPRAEDLFF